MAYSNWANAPTTDNTLGVDANGNKGTVSAGNRVTLSGTYYYQFDAEGNRTAKYINTHGLDLDSYATDMTYGWDNRNRMTVLHHGLTFYGTPDVLIEYHSDAFNRLTEEKEIETATKPFSTSATCGTAANLLEVLDGEQQRHRARGLDGEAVDQVLASGNGRRGDNQGVNWLLQGSARAVGARRGAGRRRGEQRSRHGGGGPRDL